MLINHQQPPLSWVRRIGVAAGTAAAAATIPLLALATARADATNDLLGASTDAIAATSIPDFGSLEDVDITALAPTTVPEAISASLVPINAASADVTAELAKSGLSSTFEQALDSQGQVLSNQAGLITAIGDMQGTFGTGVDVADLVKLDDLLTVANTSVLNSTTDFIGTAGESMSQQFTAGLDLAGVDFAALGTDLNVIGIGSTADLLSMFGIDPSFLFDGLSAGL